MRISVLCSDERHPVFPRLRAWCDARSDSHEIELVLRAADLSGGDLLLLISCSEIVREDVRSRYSRCLGVHASDLPKGRGWSPVVWDVLGGADHITASLISIEDPVDSGEIWRQVKIPLQGHELVTEINSLLFDAELSHMDFAVDQFDSAVPHPQSGEPTYYPRREPSDSRLDPAKTIAEQFDLLRVADPIRYPAYFDFRGHRYAVNITKVASDG